MLSFTDQLQRHIIVPYYPKRIVSIVPSQTELLYDLGLEEEVVGITKFCVHPEKWFRSKTRIGGTKQVDYTKIAELKPDLIIANKEENTKEIIDTFANDYPVWVSNISNLQDALQMIRSVGAIVNKTNEANQLADKISDTFNTLEKSDQPKRVAYFIWYNPWMTVGHDTFISNMIDTIGWNNVFADKSRYPEISLKELAAADPEVVLLSSEPYPFKEKHIAEIKEVLPEAKVILVDGEMFSWYGSRLLKAVDYFRLFLQHVKINAY